MNEPLFGRKIRQILGMQPAVDARVAARLRQAREQALARQRRGGEGLALFGGWRGLSLRVALPALALALGLAALVSWHQKQRVAELAELDTELLADELPIDAYLDKGFEAWLKSQRRSSS